MEKGGYENETQHAVVFARDVTNQRFFFFWFCYATKQPALQLQQEYIEVVNSTKVDYRLPTESNGISFLHFFFLGFRRPNLITGLQLE